jgi:glycosyltransferase involved in cell wall biosynthesis
MKKPFKDQDSVCIIRHSYYPVELNVKREAEALRDEGFDVHVICLCGYNDARQENVKEVKVYRMPVTHKREKIGRYIFEYSTFFILASFKLLALHLKYRFRVIQVNTMPDALVFVSLIPKLTGARIILHMHEPMPELFETIFDKWYNKYFILLIKLVERLSLKYADQVLTVTDEMRSKFGSRGADIKKITVILNVPDNTLFRPERYRQIKEKVAVIKKEDRDKGKFRILCHGAIEERCGFNVVVKAVARLKEDIPGIEFRFMGTGEYLSDILALAKNLAIEEHVTYLGFVPFEVMIKEILAADLTLVPFKRNPYSVLVHTNKMYEYIALQKPVVVSKLDSVAAYFSEDSLAFFEPDSDEDLAKKIKYAFTHPKEISCRVENSTRIYETYRWDNERKKYLDVYRALLNT